MGKTIAIMQPTYLPWLGYFDLIDRVDAFVFLDNVQFEKQSWQHRNRIRTATDLQWLSVPVLHSGHSGQLICDTRIANTQFISKHLRSLRLNYGRAEFFETIISEFEACFSEASKSSMLSDLNLGLIKWIVTKLGITTPLYRSSELPCKGKRSALLVEICQELATTRYLSPVGSAEYLREDREQYDRAGIEIRLHGYDHPAYRQLYSPFLPFASVLDLMFNEGPGALEVIRAGRREAGLF
jgi:hypothetical protein